MTDDLKAPQEPIQEPPPRLPSQGANEVYHAGFQLEYANSAFASDKTRGRVGMYLLIAGVVAALVLTWCGFQGVPAFIKAATVADAASKPQVVRIEALAMLAKALLYATSVGFCVALVRMGERLLTPVLVQKEIEVAKASKARSDQLGQLVDLLKQSKES